MIKKLFTVILGLNIYYVAAAQEAVYERIFHSNTTGFSISQRKNISEYIVEDYNHDKLMSCHLAKKVIYHEENENLANSYVITSLQFKEEYTTKKTFEYFS